MNRLLSVFLVIILSPAFARGQIGPYKAGEKISYIIHYGLINGGIASLELKNDTFAGKTVLHSILVAQTTGVADVLYKVRETVMRVILTRKLNFLLNQ